MADISMDMLRMVASQGLAGASGPTAPTEGAGDGESFADVLRGFLDGPNGAHLAANDKVQRFLTGEEIPVHEVMISLTEADLSTRLLTAATSKVIQAYRELERIQV